MFCFSIVRKYETIRRSPFDSSGKNRESENPGKFHTRAGKRGQSGAPELRRRSYDALSDTHPKVVEGGIGDALPGDVLAELLQHTRVLLHASRPGHQLPMPPHRHMPRLYPHEVVEGELQY